MTETQPTPSGEPMEPTRAQKFLRPYKTKWQVHFNRAKDARIAELEAALQESERRRSNQSQTICNVSDALKNVGADHLPPFALAIHALGERARAAEAKLAALDGLDLPGKAHKCVAELAKRDASGEAVRRLVEAAGDIHARLVAPCTPIAGGPIEALGSALAAYDEARKGTQ